MTETFKFFKDTEDEIKTLSYALEWKDIKMFEQTLGEFGASPELVDDKLKLSIFERCCQTPDRAEFIRACLSWGCDAHKKSETNNKSVINFAVESEDPINVEALLEDPSINTDNVFNLLASNIKKDNYENVFGCIKIFVDRQANVNIPNKYGVTPILAILDNINISDTDKQPIIQYILENATVDLDSHRSGESRKKLMDKFPSIQLPKIVFTERQWNFEHLKSVLRDGLEQDFIAGFEKSDKQFKLGDLLMVAAQMGMVRAVEKLLRNGADVNNGNGPIDEFPLGEACRLGYWEVVKHLLKCPKIDVRRFPLLIIVLEKEEWEKSKDTTKCDYSKCFDLLLNHISVDVNQQDEAGDTALHEASFNKNNSAILKLLHHGVYLGAQNDRSYLSIEDIDPKILKLHFDKCITATDEDIRPGDDDYEIKFDFSNFVPTSCRSDSDDQTKEISRTKNCYEMAPIEYMAKTRELRHLVKHPLIASFLFLKWHRLSMVFYTNFVCYSMYCMAIIAYLIFCYGQQTSLGLAAFLYTVSAIGALYMLARELLQLIVSPKVYLRNIGNYLEIALIVITVVVLVGDFIESTRRTVAAFTILLAVSEFFLLAGSLPFDSFRTHLVMLQTVSKSFLRGLLLYSIILIAFALCFYTLLSEDEITEDAIDFNKFVHPGISIVKTVVMLTGEFDAASINFQRNISSYFIFVIFVFLISIVMLNVLTGLAIIDIQEILNEAELSHFIYRADLLARYEKIFLGKTESEWCNFIVHKLLSNRMCLFSEFMPLNIITVMPNNNNLVWIPTEFGNRGPNIQFYDIGNRKYINKVRELECEIRVLGCGMGNHRMDAKIIPYAKAVLQKNEDEVTLLSITKQIFELQNSNNQMVAKIENNNNKFFAKIEAKLAQKDTEPYRVFVRNTLTSQNRRTLLKKRLFMTS